MSDTPAPVIEARGLTKRFGKVEALAGLDLVAHRGQVVALLGPNGAGKTTFVRTIATLVRPDGGSLSVDARHLAGLDLGHQPAGELDLGAQQRDHVVVLDHEQAGDPPLLGPVAGRLQLVEAAAAAGGRVHLVPDGSTGRAAA
jgi:ATPase subunit of ABC transporter with duplicated ATPase domains